MSAGPNSDITIKVVVFEQEFWLTPELQRQFAGDERYLVQYVSKLNSLNDIFDRKSPEDLEILILDFNNSAVECLNFLSDSEKNRFPSRRVIVALLESQMQSLEWRLRESGCTSVHFHPFGGEQIANTIRSAAQTVVQNQN